jgi:hypothetical protein
MMPTGRPTELEEQTCLSDIPSTTEITLTGLRPNEARSHGGASECNAATGNLQNITEKHADQPAAKRATPYRTHVLRLFNRHGYKQLVSKTV